MPCYRDIFLVYRMVKRYVDYAAANMSAAVVYREAGNVLLRSIRSKYCLVFVIAKHKRYDLEMEKNDNPLLKFYGINSI